MIHSQISCHQVLPSPGSARAWRHHQRRSSGFSPSMKAQRMQRLQQITRSLQSAALQAQDTLLRTASMLVCWCVVFAEFQPCKPREQSLFWPNTHRDKRSTLIQRRHGYFCCFLWVIPLPGKTTVQLCSHYTLSKVFNCTNNTMLITKNPMDKQKHFTISPFFHMSCCTNAYGLFQIRAVNSEQNHL